MLRIVLYFNYDLKFPLPPDFVAESPYHDVSGLPDPYMEQDETKSPVQNQHLSMSYDDALALESGYSTPNSRNRRVIHEIVV